MPAIKVGAAVFDLGGVLIDWAERGEEMAVGQFDQAVEVLAGLKAAGMRCYALSNMEGDAFRIRRARFPFMAWFDGFVISGIERVAKPDQRIFEILLRRHGRGQLAHPGARPGLRGAHVVLRQAHRGRPGTGGVGQPGLLCPVAEPVRMIDVQ